MTKNDIGTYIALVAGGLSPVLVWFKDAIGKVLDAVRVSFVAMVSSPAVWVASAAIGTLCYVGGFWMGHREGGADVPRLTAQVSALKAAAAKAEKEKESLRARIAELEAPRATGAPEAAQPAQIAPVAAVSRRPLSKALKPKPAASEPVKPFEPFKN